MSDKKNILFTITNGWGVRNYVDTDLVRKLALDFNVIILTTDNYVKHLQRLNDIGIRTVSFEYHEPIYIALLRKASKYLFQVKNSIETKEIKDKYKSLSKIKFILQQGAESLLRILLPLNFILKLSDSRFLFNTNKIIENFYLENEIDFVINGSPFDPLDNAFLSPAFRQRIDSFCLIPSWDNPSTKGTIFSVYKRVIVWGEAQKQEILNYYGSALNGKVFIAGVLQHDFYKDKMYQSDRSFKSELGIPENCKIILFATGSDKLTPNEYLIADRIVKWINDNPRYNLHLVIRCHPMDDYKKYSYLEKEKRVTIFPSSNINGNLYQWIPYSDEIYRLKAMIESSLITINTASTMTLDSLACGVCVLNLSFDLVKTPSHKSVSRFYGYTHYKVVTNSGVVPIVKNENQLFDKIVSYIDGSNYFSKKEEELYNKLCGNLGCSVDSHIKIIRDYCVEKY